MASRRQQGSGNACTWCCSFPKKTNPTPLTLVPSSCPDPVFPRFYVFFIRFAAAAHEKTADGASVLGGFGFQGYGDDGKVIGWDGVRNFDISIHTERRRRREREREGEGRDVTGFSPHFADWLVIGCWNQFIGCFFGARWLTSIFLFRHRGVVISYRRMRQGCQNRTATHEVGPPIRRFSPLKLRQLTLLCFNKSTHMCFQRHGST